jgi:hypothetical protein
MKGTTMSDPATVSVVTMLDVSATMRSAMAIVKIDAKAFVRAARPQDQIAVIAFTDASRIVYPTPPALATVSQSLNETRLAAQAIEDLTTGDMTNMAAAITQGNALMAGATGAHRAFVMLTDGLWNEGGDPAAILGATPPIYIAGLGPFLKEAYFQAMLGKNSQSKYHHAPNAYQMMQIFNAIRAESAVTGLVANNLTSCQGSDYYMVSNQISADTDAAQFSVVWSDASYHYTSGNPGGKAINVILIDPNGNVSPVQPDIADPGYAIFNLVRPMPGTWQALIQYSVPAAIWGTMGGLEFDTQVHLHVDAPQLVRAGEALQARVQVLDEGQPVENLRIRAHVTRPTISIANALVKHAAALRQMAPDAALTGDGQDDDLARLAAFRQANMAQGDILQRTTAFSMLAAQDDGSYQFHCANTAEAGSYDVVLHVDGANPVTGRRFTRTQRFSTLVV